jgi:hypothetical protein
MQVLDRQTFAPIALCAGDTLIVSHIGDGWFGRKKVLCKTTVIAEQAMIFDEAVWFETVFENRRAMGGLVLEKI